MLTIIIYVLYRSVDYGQRATIVCHNFQLSKYVLKEESTARLFGFNTGTKGCCGASSYGFWEKFNIFVVCGSETQTKGKERGTVVASPLRSIVNDQVEAMREDGITATALPCCGTMK